jgi:GMP synthase (glutamine-hydrolysing)
MAAASRRILLVLHQEMSNPGRVAEVLRTLGYELDVCRPMCGQCLPESMDEHDGAVIFGGPMSANDEHLPGIRAELDFIPKVLAAGKPYLGICLGAQMLSRVLGGRVEPHPDGLFEIGFFDIAPTAQGEALIEAPTRFYEWHSEGFSVPACCARLATGPFFENQMFRYDGNAYGIQFHPEVTGEMLRLWTRRAAHRLTLPGAQCRQSQLRHADSYDAVARDFLERLLPMWLGLDQAQRTVR